MNSENLQTDRFLTAKIRVYYDLLLPENRLDGEPSPLLIALHGYGGNKRAMLREVRALAPENFAIASVEGVHQHWRDQTAPDKMPKVGFAWLTNHKSEDSVDVHHQILLSLTANLINQGIADKTRIYLLGFSQSCALNFRFAFSNPHLLRAIVGISGGIPGDWETNENYQSLEQPIFYLYGTHDEFYTLEKFEQNAEKLKSRAANLQSKVYDAPHEITDEMRADLKNWLQAVNQDESKTASF